MKNAISYTSWQRRLLGLSSLFIQEGTPISGQLTDIGKGFGVALLFANLFRKGIDPSYSTGEFLYDETGVSIGLSISKVYNVLAWEGGAGCVAIFGVAWWYGKLLYDGYKPLFEYMEKRHNEVFPNGK